MTTSSTVLPDSFFIIALIPQAR